MIVTIHQPNLFPWLGFFDKMASSDLFVLLDNVAFTKGGFQNRVRIKGPDGSLWLTVPVVTAGRLGQITADVETNNDSPWVKKHIVTIKTSYKKSSGYNAVMAWLEELYQQPCSTLVDFTIPGILAIKEHLGIKTPVVRASELSCDGKGSELLARIAKEVGATTYLSGPSGKKYLDQSYFNDNGIEIMYHEFKPFTYAQPGEFESGLSSLDYLFNEPQMDSWAGR